MVDVENTRKSLDVIGCGDSMISVSTDRLKTGNTPNDIKIALNELFAITDANFGKGGMYNSIYQSDLEVASVDAANGDYTVNITGKVLKGGTCDDPRFTEQIKRTITQFSDVKTVKIFVNNTELK